MWKRLLRAYRAFQWKPRPQLPPEVTAELRHNRAALDAVAMRRDWIEAGNRERMLEMVEAQQMAGAGPWTMKTANATAVESMKVKESNPITAQGAFGDIELALQNVEWRREINLSWLEFSRWGIQQIILISRLYYIKNPLIRRLINISAAYVFGRGVEVSCDDDAGNDTLQEFFERNKATLGQIALVNLERRKYYDGNLFFAFFSDTTDKGQVTVRDLDATEIQDIVTDPQDADQPWFYKREWTERIFDPAAGTTQTQSRTAWYPALQYVVANPGKRTPKTIGDKPVMWDIPVLHRKVGAVAKWHFGCPLIYPAIDWAREAKRFLEHCATVKAALAQFAMMFTTKGGQQAIEGFKQQVQTSVGPTSSLWDQNPDAVAGSTAAMGPGSKLEVFNTRGGGGDPEEVRQYKLMCCIVVGVPETFLGDVKTGNLATAASLDRPTELIFMEKQEEWREDLVTIATYVLNVSKGAPSGKLRAALVDRKMSPADMAHLDICEAGRVQVMRHGSLVWTYEAPKKSADKIKVRCNFPEIREGDVKVLVDSVVEAMTLGNKSGQVIGIDEKEGVRMLFDIVGFEGTDEIVELMYPEKEYEPDRTQQEVEDPLQKPQPLAPGQDKVNPKPGAQPTKEHLAMARRAVESVLNGS